MVSTHSRGACLGALLLAAVPSSAHAAPQWCSGSVDTSWIQADGSVFIGSSWRGGQHTQVCNVMQEWKGIAVDVCIGWVAKLDTAAAMNKLVTVYYQDAPTCDSLPTYGAAPAPSYVMLLRS